MIWKATTSLVSLNNNGNNKADENVPIITEYATLSILSVLINNTREISDVKKESIVIFIWEAVFLIRVRCDALKKAHELKIVANNNGYKCFVESKYDSRLKKFNKGSAIIVAVIKISIAIQKTTEESSMYLLMYSEFFLLNFFDMVGKKASANIALMLVEISDILSAKR